MLKKILISLSMLCFITSSMAQEGDPKDNKEDETKRPSWSAGLPERQKPASLDKPEFKPEIDNSIELDMSEFGLKPKAEIEIDLPIKSDIGGLPAADSEESIAVETNVAEQQAIEVEPEPVVAEAQPEPVVSEPETEPIVEDPIVEDSVEIESIAEQPASAPVEQPPVSETQQIDAATLADTEEQNDVDEPVNETTVAAEDIDTESNQVSQETISLPEEQSIASVEPPVSSQPIDYTAAEVASKEAEYKWNILTRAPVKYPVKAAIDNLEGWVEVEITINPSGEVVSASAIKYSRRGRIFGKPAVQSVNDWLFEPPSNIGINTNLTRVYKVEFDL